MKIYYAKENYIAEIRAAEYRLGEIIKRDSNGNDYYIPTEENIIEANFPEPMPLFAL